MVSADARCSGGSCSANDGRTGQTSRRSSRGGGLRCELHRMVCRGGKTNLRGHDTRACSRQAGRRDQAAGRYRRLHHAMELSERDARTKDCTGARSRMHGCVQARKRNAVIGAGDGRAGRSRRYTGRCDQCPRRRDSGNWRRTDWQPQGAQAYFYRLDGCRKTAHAAMCQHGETDVDGTRR